jgi:bacteriorhodopsin
VPVTRHIDWLLSTPLLLLALAFVAGLDGSNIIVVLFANFVVVAATWGFAFANREPGRWGWFAMAAIAYLVVLYQLVGPARLAVAKREKRVREIFGAVAGFEVLIWAAYLVVTGKFEIPLRLSCHVVSCHIKHLSLVAIYLPVLI